MNMSQFSSVYVYIRLGYMRIGDSIGLKGEGRVSAVYRWVTTYLLQLL